MQAAAGKASMTTSAAPYTASELLAVMSARLLRDGQVVFAGVGIPLLAATLAQRLHAPGLTILFEGGIIGAFVEPGKLPPSTNEQRCTRRANMVLGSTEVLLLLQRGCPRPPRRMEGGERAECPSHAVRLAESGVCWFG